MLNTVLFGNVTFFDLFLSVAIILASWPTAQLLTNFLRRVFKDKVSKDNLQIIIKTAYYGVFTLALLIALPLLGIRLSGLLVAGGFAGIVIGFASQNIVSNFISGVFLMIERPIKIGDAVNIDGTVGIVNDIKIMSTEVRTLDGLYVRIPNIHVFTGSLTNYVSNIVRRFGYIIGIRYRDDTDLAIKTINDVINREEMALINPAPMVFVDNLTERAVELQIFIWAPTTEWYTLKTELLIKIKKALEQNGIQLAFPHRVISFEDKAAEGDDGGSAKKAHSHS
ncbi:MAG: mechanosensitive ion channel family protein [bacterium]